jgi:hypothetical protein
MPKLITLGAVNPQLDIDLDEWTSTKRGSGSLEVFAGC